MRKRTFFGAVGAFFAAPFVDVRDGFKDKRHELTCRHVVLDLNDLPSDTWVTFQCKLRTTARGYDVDFYVLKVPNEPGVVVPVLRFECGDNVWESNAKT